MRRTFVVCFFLVISILLFTRWCNILYGNDSLSAGRESLIDKYHQIETKLEKSSFGIPVYLESSVEQNASHVDIYGIVEHSFTIVQNVLRVPTNWCDIVLPHIYVRACYYKKVNNTWLLNTYNFDKFSESLDDAYQMKSEYRVTKSQPGYFDISLAAKEGPFNTKEHQFKFEAVPLDKDKTFIHLQHYFAYSTIGYYIMKIFGGSKPGFSVIGMNSDGSPIYTNGLSGGVERNAVCYYFAILAYLDTLKTPAGQRFEKRISQWYDLAAPYKIQIFEIKKEEYITDKRQADKVSKILQEGQTNKIENRIGRYIKSCL
ncbi:MAG: hypothetical protein NT010_11795 [Proteobacteria bacterium]|nr:hypothetical protein [Pseudomonadota bacterium]